MKKAFITIALLLGVCAAKAQISAVTSTGEEVLLNEDGTWKYATTEKSGYDTRLDTAVYNKPASATFLVKSEKFNVGVYIDSKKWRFTKQQRSENAAAEYMFNLKTEDAYAMAITERMSIPLNQLAELALQNAQNKAPDAKLMRDEMRRVNGHLVRCLQIAGTISGIKFVYYGYYFSNENGTIQLVAFTSQKLFDKYKPEMEQLLNGLTTTKDDPKE